MLIIKESGELIGCTKESLNYCHSCIWHKPHIIAQFGECYSKEIYKKLKITKGECKMRAKIEQMIDAYVEDENHRQRVKDFVEHLIRNKSIILSVDNIAIRTMSPDNRKVDYSLNSI